MKKRVEMDNFSIDLDQALNELERQESEELKLKNKQEVNLEIEQGVILDQNSIEKNEISLIKHFNADNSTSTALITTTTTPSESDLLERELNEIMQSLQVNNLNDLNKVEKEVKQQDEVQEKVEEILQSLDDLNLTVEIEGKNTESHDKPETNPIQIKRLESIELESTESNQLTGEQEEEEKRDSDILDEKFSSPNEDSECYFDTIEMTPTLATLGSNELLNHKQNQSEVEVLTVLHNENEIINDSNEITTDETKAEVKSDALVELNNNLIEETPQMINNVYKNDEKEVEKLEETLNNADESVSNHQDSSNSTINCFESLNDLNRTELDTVPEHETPKPIENESDNLTQQDSSQTSQEKTLQNETSELDASACEQEVNNSASQAEEEPNVPIEIIDYQTEWSQLSESEKTLGLIAPQWMPDSETDACLKCSVKFSFRTRRHHCRACGLIFCSKCCYLKLTLPYNISDDNVQPNKSQTSRCCNVCFEIINKVNNLRVNMLKMSSSTPVVSVLKKKTNSILNQTGNETVDSELPSTSVNESDAACSRMVRSKSVRFSDGVAPGGELENKETLSPSSPSKTTDLPGSDETQVNKIKKKSSYLLSKKYKISNKSTFRQSRFIEEELINRIRLTLIKNNLLPPILDKDEIADIGTVCPDEETLIKEKLLSSDSDYVTFMLLRNLKVYVRIINFDCGCSKQKCWLFTTNGLCLNGQDEIVFVLKCQIDEQTNEFKETQIPREIFYHIMDIYDKSSKGFKITHMSHLFYDFEALKRADQQSGPPEKYHELLGNKENVGFFYYYPSEFHFKCCFKSIGEYLPEEKFLIGFLIQKWEVSWAKLFPLRLYLSIGERFNSYPTYVISDRHRKSVFGDIGHTIMSLLCDVRNFQYTIAQIDGLKIQLESTSTRILIPESQYDLIVKSILTSNDYVFSMACLQLDDTCNSHLAAVENENLGSYSSKTISFNNHNDDTLTSNSNKRTGAGFVVFNGALKANLTNNAKISVVEDGIMIQIETETINKLKQALQSMKPFKLDTLKPNLNSQTNLDNNVISVEWTKDSHINKGVCSIIDGRSLTGVKSLRLSNTYDYVNETKGLRWTEIYLVQIEDDSNVINDNNFNLNRFADMCSTAFCTAITPLLDQLISLQKLYLTSQNKLIESRNPISECSSSSSSNNESDLIKYSQLINPFKVALRISIDKDQVGYQMGMNGSQISEDVFLANLDNELIQLLNHASSFNISIVLELIFYVQERFNCSNRYVIQR